MTVTRGSDQHDAVLDVERVLSDYPGLAEVFVCDQVDAKLGSVLIAYVVPGGPGFRLGELHTHLRQRLGVHSLPAAVIVIDVLPRSSAGDIILLELPIPDLRGVAVYRAPETPRQSSLCSIFADVLARSRCGLDDDFFMLGGESIDAMLIASRVGLLVGTEVSMNDLFDAPTVSELDQLLDSTSER